MNGRLKSGRQRLEKTPDDPCSVFSNALACFSRACIIYGAASGKERFCWCALSSKPLPIREITQVTSTRNHVARSRDLSGRAWQAFHYLRGRRSPLRVSDIRQQALFIPGRG